MLIAIILCLFSVAFGAPYYVRLDGVPVPAFGNAGSLSVGAVPNNPYASLYGYNTVRYIPNQAYNLPYNRNYFYGSQGAYAPQYQQGYQVPVSGLQYILPNVQNSGSQQSQVANARSVQNVQEVGDQQVGQSQVPANVEPVVRGQVVVQAVADPNAAQQSVGSVQSVGQAVGVVSNSYQPFIGYSQQIPVVAIPVVGTPYARSLQNVQNLQEVSPIGQQVGQSQVPSNVEVKGQGVVQSAADVNNNVQQQQQQPNSLVANVGDIRNQVVGGVPNSYLPLIGYSQQLPVVSVPYARNIDGQVVSNVGIRAVNGVNGHVG